MRCEIGNVANESWCQSSGGHHGTLSPTLNHYSINQGRQSNLTSNVARRIRNSFCLPNSIRRPIAPSATQWRCHPQKRKESPRPDRQYITGQCCGFAHSHMELTRWPTDDRNRVPHRRAFHRGIRNRRAAKSAVLPKDCRAIAA
jgi:hypothetical protein